MYVGIGPEQGTVVPKQAAILYAMERCGIRFAPERGVDTDEFLQMLEEWYYSGNWIEEAEKWTEQNG